MLFDGGNASGSRGLWVTDGTAAGTHELTGIKDAYSGPPLPGFDGFTGLIPFDFTVFNREALFAGADTSGRGGLWVTDGTAAGTRELTGIEGAYTGPPLPHGVFGLYPYDLTEFNGEVLFGGLAANGQFGVWATDGTAAGTHELTGSGGVYAGPIDPSLMTVFNGKVLIRSEDDGSLWVSNGTAAGTHELTGISGVDTRSGLNPGSFTVFKSEVLFSGVDASGKAGLWVTDGTAAGTHELAGIKGAYAGPGGLSATGGGVFGSDGQLPFTVLAGKVLFNGRNASGNFGLWVTDGTAAGTHELIGIKGANPGGINPVDFTVFDGEVLFRGHDASGQIGLWVTDGTAAGTHELPGVGGGFLIEPQFAEMTVTPLPSPPPSGLALAPSSDSVVNGDDITNVTRPAITGRGEAGDTVTLRDGAKVVGTAKVAAGGAWSVTPASALAAGVHTLTATEGGASGTSDPSAALKLTIKVAAPAPSGLSFAVAADKGVLGDTITVAGKGEAGDAITLFDGARAIGTAKVAAGGAWSITTAKPLAIGAHSLTTSEVDVAANKSAATPAQSLSFLAATPNRAVFVGTAGTDVFTGGAGNDVFRFSAADLATIDVAEGGLGSDELVMTTAGTVRVDGVSGVETYVLASGGANTLTLAKGNFTNVTGGAIAISDGNNGTAINAASLPAGDAIIIRAGGGVDNLTGGAADDIFFAGGKTAMTGNAGANQFVFTAPGANTIADFATSATNEVVVDNAGFKLGLGGLGATPTPLPASLFTSNSTGAFTAPTQRFAYDTKNSELFFSASGTTGTEHLVATLTGHPALDHLFVVGSTGGGSG